jgi:hypothetical protein
MTGVSTIVAAAAEAADEMQNVTLFDVTGRVTT